MSVTSSLWVEELVLLDVWLCSQEDMPSLGPFYNDLPVFMPTYCSYILNHWLAPQGTCACSNRVEWVQQPQTDWQHPNHGKVALWPLFKTAKYVRNRKIDFTFNVPFMNRVSCFITQYTARPYKYLSDPVWKKSTSETWGFCLPCSSPRKYDLWQEQHCYTFKASSPCSQQLVMVKYECCLHILYGTNAQAASPTCTAGTASMRDGREAAQDCHVCPWTRLVFITLLIFSFPAPEKCLKF